MVADIDGTRNIVILGFFVEFWAYSLSFFTNFTGFALFFLSFAPFCPFFCLFCLFFVGGLLVVTSEGRGGEEGVIGGLLAVGGLLGVADGLAVVGDGRGGVDGLTAVGVGRGEVWMLSASLTRFSTLVWMLSTSLARLSALVWMLSARLLGGGVGVRGEVGAGRWGEGVGGGCPLKPGLGPSGQAPPETPQLW